MEPWMSVRDYVRGRLRDVYVICPACWPDHGGEYAQESSDQRVGWTTEVRTIDPAQLQPDVDTCHVCGKAPGAAVA